MPTKKDDSPLALYSKLLEIAPDAAELMLRDMPEIADAAKATEVGLKAIDTIIDLYSSALITAEGDSNYAATLHVGKGSNGAPFKGSDGYYYSAHLNIYRSKRIG